MGSANTSAPIVPGVPTVPETWGVRRGPDTLGGPAGHPVRPGPASRRVGELGANYFDHLDGLIDRARRRGQDVIDLSKGNPDLATPDHVVRALQAAVEEPANQAYPPFLAKRSVREAIAERYRVDHGVDLDPDLQVTAFHGAHEALVALPWALMDAEDVLVLTDPCYPPYLSAAQLAGVEVRRVPLVPELGHRPDLDTLDSSLEGVRLLLLNFPNNPTGAVADEALWRGVLDVAPAHGTTVVNDFAYSSLDFEHTRAVSLLAADPGGVSTLEISTLSKTYSMAGWRFGYAVGDPRAVAALRAHQNIAFSTIFGAVQDAAEAALRGDQDQALAIAATYRSRREFLAGGLRAQGWHVAPTGGTFFLWVRARAGLDGEETARRLLEEAGVAVAPGAGFGPRGRDWFRLSVVHPQDTLRSALARLGEWSSRLEDPRDAGGRPRRVGQLGESGREGRW